MSEIDAPEPCVECGAPTEIICSWCGVPLCQHHRRDVPVHWETPGGMLAGVSAESYCESCMPDDDEQDPGSAADEAVLHDMALQWADEYDRR